MDEFELNEIEETNPARVYLGKDEEESWEAIYYMDSQGEYWDEISNKKPNQNGVIAARLDEIRQVHSHGVYEKVPMEECYTRTGKGPIKVKWVDINKGDELNMEYMG